MIKLKEETVELMARYLEMLEGIEEGLVYIEKNINVLGLASKQVPQVFEDVLEALQHVNHAHAVFKQEIDVSEELVVFDHFVEALSGWHEVDSNGEKGLLIQEQALPMFKRFRHEIDQKLIQYVAH